MTVEPRTNENSTDTRRRSLIWCSGRMRASFARAGASIYGPGQHGGGMLIAHRNEKTFVIEQCRVISFLNVLSTEGNLHSLAVARTAQRLASSNSISTQNIAKIYHILRKFFDLRKTKQM